MSKPTPLVDVTVQCGACHAHVMASTLTDADKFDAMHFTIDAARDVCPKCFRSLYKVDVRVHPIPPGEVSTL